MKTETFNNLIIESIEATEKNIEYTSEIMKQVQEIKHNKAKFVLRKVWMIAALMILCTTIVYAGVVTLQRIELKNSEDEVVSTVEIVETDENPHLDSHISREELFRYGDSLHGSKEWEGKSFIVVDTTIGYPMGVDIRPISKNFHEYDKIDIDDNMIFLPERIGDYEFESISIHYDFEYPDKAFVKSIIEDNNEERFVVKEIGTGGIRGVSYSYVSSSGELKMTIHLDMEDEKKFMTMFTSTVENYEVVRVDDIDVFLTESNYMGVSYFANKTVKRKGINHFKTSWFEADQKQSVNINPGFKTYKRGVEEEIDGEYVETITYPEDTKAEVIEFTRLILEVFKQMNND